MLSKKVFSLVILISITIAGAVNAENILVKRTEQYGAINLKDYVKIEDIRYEKGYKMTRLSFLVRNNSLEMLQEALLELDFYDNENNVIGSIQYNALGIGERLRTGASRIIDFPKSNEIPKKTSKIDIKVLKAMPFRMKLIEVPEYEQTKITAEVFSIEKGENAFALRGMIINRTTINLGYVKLRIKYTDSAGNDNSKEYVAVDVNSLDRNVRSIARARYKRPFLYIVENYKAKKIPVKVEIEIIKLRAISDNDVLELQKIQKDKEKMPLEQKGDLKLGAGYGPLYGILGVGSEMVLGDYISISAGLGSGEALESGSNIFWSIGAKIYFLVRLYGT